MVRFCVSRPSFPLLTPVIYSEHVSPPPKSQSRRWVSRAHFSSQMVHFRVSGVSFPSLTIPYAFLFTASVLLRRQRLKPVTDCPAHISAPRQCLSASLEPHPCHWPSPVLFCSQRARFSAAKVLIPSLTVPRAFLLLDSTFPRHWSLIPVTVRPLYVSVHSKRASPPPKSQSRR